MTECPLEVFETLTQIEVLLMFYSIQNQKAKNV